MEHIAIGMLPVDVLHVWVLFACVPGVAATFAFQTGVRVMSHAQTRHYGAHTIRRLWGPLLTKEVMHLKHKAAVRQS
jgi:hypothetical protein